MGDLCLGNDLGELLILRVDLDAGVGGDLNGGGGVGGEADIYSLATADGDLDPAAKAAEPAGGRDGDLIGRGLQAGEGVGSLAIRDLVAGGVGTQILDGDGGGGYDGAARVGDGSGD